MVFTPFKFGGLALSALVIGLPTGVAAQSPAFPPETLLSREFAPNPLKLMGNSGGQFPANRVIAQERTPTGLCLGYINAAPNHIMTLEVFFDYLSVKVDSEQDTTLIVQGPGGIWCSDDVQGHNPAIEGQWLAGTYQIWVGSYAEERSADYTLLIESTPAIKAKNRAEDRI